jgi:transposase
MSISYKNKELLDLSELSRKLNLSRATIYRWIKKLSKSGLSLPYYQIAGIKYYDFEEIIQFGRRGD